MAKTKLLICPYCGETQPASERCRGCGGLFEPLSRQATHNAMGPWFVRDPSRPFHPGCSYETLIRLVDRGQVTKVTVIRGPTTRQFWTVARRVPGVAHLLGYCHACDASVDRDEHACHACGAQFGAYLDRNYLGLPEVRPLPWEARLEDDEGGHAVASLGRPRPAGLSRFASDEELLARPKAGVAAAAPAPAVGAEADRPGAGDPDSYAQSVLTRALQRKVASQRRSIRVLGVLVVVVGVLTVVLNVAPMVIGSEEPEAGTNEATPSTASSRSGVESPPPAARRPDTPRAARPAGSAEPVSTGEAPGPGGPAAPEPDDRYDAALVLIAAAGDDTRAATDRIADYERALELLDAVRAGDEGARPAGLDELIERTRRDLERVRLLEEFFDEPPVPTR